MQGFVRTLLVTGILAVVAGSAAANGFYAAFENVDYRGKITNANQTVWRTDAPKQANLQIVNGLGQADRNHLVCTSFFNNDDRRKEFAFWLAEDGNPSVTSALGQWDDTQTHFTVMVTGQNAAYPMSQLWLPTDDGNGVVRGGTFTQYAYRFTVEFADPAELVDGSLENSSNVANVTGYFSGTFVPTFELNQGQEPTPINNGSPYQFCFSFGGSEVNASAGLVVVPEPLTILGVFGAVAGIGGYIRGRKVDVYCSPLQFQRFHKQDRTGCRLWPCRRKDGGDEVI